MNKSLALAAIALLLGAAGCKNSNDTTAASTTSSTTRTTDTFSGTVQVGGHDFHSFAVTATGQIDVTLTAAAPPATVVMGVSIGTPGTTTCPALAGATVNAAAGTVAQLSGMATAGALCVDVRDVGNQPGPVNYTVTVLHP
jgi:hypothetical protein